MIGAMTPASADDIANNLDGTVDADAESVNTVVGAGGVVVGLSVRQTDSDGNTNCNLTGRASATFDVISSSPSVATVAPSSVTFNNCGVSNFQNVTVTPVAPGSSTISLVLTSTTASGSFNTLPARFTVNVGAAPAPECPAVPTTAPTVVESNSPDATTGYYNTSSPAAAFTVNPGANAEYSLDGGTTWVPYGSEVVFTTDGSRSVIARSFRPASTGCIRVNGPASAPTSFLIDRTAPVLGLLVAPGANGAGWNNTPVVVDWTCTEAGSGLVGACPSDVTYVHGANVGAADFSVTDVAGNTSTNVNRRAVKVDTVAPTLSASVTAANAAGWNNTLVTVNWACTDDSSGFADPTPCPTDESFGEAHSPVAERPVSVTDQAGNVSSYTRRAIRIDVTQPSAVVLVTPDPTADGWNNGTVSADYTCADGGSGLDAATPCPTDESFTAEGSYPAFSFSVGDNAGNTSATATRRAVKIDTTPPTVSVTLRNGAGTAIAANANGWFNQAVTVDFTCTDPTSGGVASGVATTGMPCPADHTLTSDGTHSVSYDVADRAGNSTTGVIPDVRIDTTAPTNTVVGVSPDQSFVVGNVPAISCQTTDGLSGVATSATLGITGGSPAGVGQYTATCSGGTDRAGNSAQTAQVTFSVGYGFVGFFQPINDPATASTQSSFKKGSTIPVKFALTGSTGARIADAEAQALADTCSVRLFWVKGSQVTSGESEALNTNPANTGNCFRYDPTTDQFIYNLGTKDFTVGTWTLIARVISGGGEHTVHGVNVTVR